MVPVSRRGFYRSLKEQQPVEEEMEVRSAIQQIALEHRRRYGYRRITAELHRRGMPVNLCLVKTKSTFEINNLKKRDVTMLHAIWLGEITIRHGQVRARFTDLLSNNARSNRKRCHGFGFPYQLSVSLNV
jgi:hypothetical protein